MLVCGRINLYSCQEYSRRTEDQLESKWNCMEKIREKKQSLVFGLKFLVLFEWGHFTQSHFTLFFPPQDICMVMEVSYKKWQLWDWVSCDQNAHSKIALDRLCDLGQPALPLRVLLDKKFLLINSLQFSKSCLIHAFLGKEEPIQSVLWSESY
jgi:hypothetical protein